MHIRNVSWFPSPSPPLTPSPYPNTSLFYFLVLFFTFLWLAESNLGCLHVYRHTAIQQPPSNNTYKEKWLFQRLSAGVTPQLVCCGEGLNSPPPSFRNVEHFVLLQVTTAAVSSWAQWAHHAQRTAFQGTPSHFLAFTIFAFFLLEDVPWT